MKSSRLICALLAMQLLAACNNTQSTEAEPIKVVYSGSANYLCKIMNILELSDDGNLSDSQTFKFMVGKTFFVDRVSGVIHGNGVSNSNLSGTPRVLDSGSSQQAFKVMTEYAPMVSVAYLEIKEYSDFNEKSFIFYRLHDVYTGTCTYAN
jgi:hypothetical protein